jgi:phage shock protein C
MDATRLWPGCTQAAVIAGMTAPRPTPTPRQPPVPRQQSASHPQPGTGQAPPAAQRPGEPPAPIQQPTGPTQASPSRPPEPAPPKRERRLERSQDDRVVAGVCGGIGAYLGSDPTWVRIAWIVITLLTSVLPMVVIYVLLAAVLPTAPSTRAAGPAEAAQAAPAAAPSKGGSRPDWGIAFGVLLLAVGVMLLLAQFVPLRWDLVWPLSLIALGIAFLLVAARRRSRGQG